MCEIHSFPGRAYTAPTSRKEASEPRASLTPEAAPAEPRDVVLSWNPQDIRTTEPTTRTVQATGNESGQLATERVRLRDGLTPNQDGNFVYPQGTSEHARASAFTAVSSAVDTFRELFGEYAWAFDGPELGVHGDGGKSLNAFYRRENSSVAFYHYPDRQLKTTVFTGGSNDVASHETGHAILDGIRPQYYASLNAEPRAFHEAFGDCMAIHMSLLNDKVVDLVAAQTGGDLSKPNAAAQVAEELGQAVNHNEGANVTGGDFLRDANNSFTWQDPSTLPSEKGGPNELGWGRHSLGRLWTGAHFDILKAVVNQKMAAGMDAKTAISTGNREVFQRMANLLKEAPKGDFTYKDMAEAMLRAEEKYAGGQYTDLMRQCYVNRKILPENEPVATTQSSFGSLTDAEPENLQVRLDDSFGMFRGARIEIPYDPSTSETPRQAEARTLTSLHRLIDSGRVRYNDPGYQMKFPTDHLNGQGEPYVAAVHWEDGEMVIRPLAFTVCA